jgi:predicted component of type VI protein secretion system
MPLIKVIRKGVTPSIRKVPTSTCAVLMPMTLERVGREAASEDEAPVKVEDVNDAFSKFQPAMYFKANAGPQETEFVAEFKFKSIKDFDPENLQKRQEVRSEDGGVIYARNDIADLKRNIDLMYRLKDRWGLPAVRRAWANESQRKEIIAALGRLRGELEKVAGQRGGE